MPFVTIKASTREGAYDGPDGTFQATLVEVSDPREITVRATGEQRTVIDWTWAINGAPDEACLVWSTTSTATSPKSKLYGYLTALLGQAVPVGTDVEREQLVGREAIVTIVRNAEGYTNIESVGAVPAKVPPRPATGRPGALRQQVAPAAAAAVDDRPF